MPQEVEVRYVLPSLRKELAIELKNKGLKQREIASTLNITAAAVSQYVKEKRGTTEFNNKIKKQIERSSEIIINDRFATQRELFKLTEMIRESKILCEIHRQHDCIPEKCDFCFTK